MGRRPGGWAPPPRRWQPWRPDPDHRTRRSLVARRRPGCRRGHRPAIGICSSTASRRLVNQSYRVGTPERASWLHHPSRGALEAPVDGNRQLTRWQPMPRLAPFRSSAGRGKNVKGEDREMRDDQEHALVPTLKRQLAENAIDRREFLRYATLLGMSASAAYAFVEHVTGQSLVAPVAAQTGLPKGGTLRLAMRCQDLKSPHTFSWIESSNSVRQVLDYLAVTGADNVTRPALIEKWEASTDLKTWTLRVRKGVKCHHGRT